VGLVINTYASGIALSKYFGSHNPVTVAGNTITNLGTIAGTSEGVASFES
jgi:predicted nicotinamide N-methyase